jgi:hypothetical protein
MQAGHKTTQLDRTGGEPLRPLPPSAHARAGTPPSYNSSTAHKKKKYSQSRQATATHRPGRGCRARPALPGAPDLQARRPAGAPTRAANAQWVTHKKNQLRCNPTVPPDSQPRHHPAQAPHLRAGRKQPRRTGSICSSGAGGAAGMPARRLRVQARGCPNDEARATANANEMQVV